MTTAYNVSAKVFWSYKIMSMSKQSLEMLLDLVEIKLGALLVQDKDDTKELNRLKSCKNELAQLIMDNQLNKNKPFNSDRKVS